MLTSLKNLRLRTQLAASYALLLLLMVGIVGVAAWQMRSMAAVDREVEVLTQRAIQFEEWKTAVGLNLSRAMALAKSSYQANLAAYLEPQMKSSSARISELQKQIQAQLATPAQRSEFEAVGARRKAYVDSRNRVAEMFKAGQGDEAMAVVDSEMRARAQAYLDSLMAMKTSLEQQRARLKERATEQASQALLLLGVLAVLALLLGSLLAWQLTRSITRPLLVAVQAARHIADGRLNHRFETEARGDEIGELQQALNHMQQSLCTMVAQIRLSTDSISTASAQIAAGSTDLSARTEMAASSLQETASSMEQLTSTVSRTADSACTARDLAGSATTVAERGGEVVRAVVHTMDQINQSSKRIADITSVIDGIAFQTNILALNAAVESARAGEHGRGFAVVANEVRSLAQRSADAAREIKTLINSSVEKVEMGAQQVADAGRTMSDIVSSVRRVSEIIQDITTATSEQSQGIGQVNSAVSHLDHATQQNAALVEQSTAAAESMNDQAKALQGAVACFSLA